MKKKETTESEKPFILYPGGEAHREEKGAKFGNFDFFTIAPKGLKVAIEWETGNISSSHRALNKLCSCLADGVIDAGVLIVPSRKLYKHLTDRIGNIFELTPYLPFWKRFGSTVKRGLLVITVVEHDHTTRKESFKYLKVGKDGNAGRVEKRDLEL